MMSWLVSERENTWNKNEIPEKRIFLKENWSERNIILEFLLFRSFLVSWLLLCTVGFSGILLCESVSIRNASPVQENPQMGAAYTSHITGWFSGLRLYASVGSDHLRRQSLPCSIILPMSVARWYKAIYCICTVCLCLENLARGRNAVFIHDCGNVLMTFSILYWFSHWSDFIMLEHILVKSGFYLKLVWLLLLADYSFLISRSKVFPGNGNS